MKVQLTKQWKPLSKEELEALRCRASITIKRLLVTVATLELERDRLRTAATELCDVVEQHAEDGDSPDSFTTQPMREALAATPRKPHPPEEDGGPLM